MEAQAAIDIGNVTPNPLRPSRRLAAIGFFVLLGVFLASVFYQPQSGNYFTICAFKNLTGLPCPGCGLTHSFCALAKGDIGDAFLFNALGPPLFVALFLLWIRSVFVLLNRFDVVEFLDRIPGRFNPVKTFALAFAVYGVGRIVYVLIFTPAVFGNSPLSSVLSALFH